MERTKRTEINWLCESAIMIALSFVLSLIKVVDLPFGGSVTVGSMVPVAIVAYRYGTLRGIATAFIYSLTQLLTGLKNFSYATSAQAVIMILLFDYIVAFSVIGLVGAFRNRIKNQQLAMCLGMALACVLRYICHCISGCTVWAGVSIPSKDGIIYSLGYNATYMIPETIVAVAFIWYLSKMLDFSSQRISGSKSVQKTGVGITNAVATLLVLGAAVYDAVEIFVHTQVKSGFDITAVVGADFVAMAIVTAVCVAAAAVLVVIGKVIENKR